MSGTVAEGDRVWRRSSGAVALAVSAHGAAERQVRWAAQVHAPPTVKTLRLLLRPPEPEDVGPLFEIQGDPEAMCHTYVAPDRDATARYLETYAARFAEDGFAPWTVVLQSERRVIGWGGLNRDPNAAHWGAEVSYFIHRFYWSRGVATELVQASLELAFRRVGLPKVLAFTKSENAASRHVLQKCGFTFVRYVSELERDQYAIDRSAWEGAA